MIKKAARLIRIIYGRRREQPATLWPSARRTNSTCKLQVSNDVKHHRAEAKRLQRVVDVVRDILLDHEVSRQTFDNVMCDFSEEERAHMQMEESVLFRAAVNASRPDG